MKILTKRFSLLLTILFLAVTATTAQTAKTYQQMNGDEQKVFIAEHSAKVAKAISNRDYALTEEYRWLIKQYVDAYLRRVNNGKTEAGRSDIKLVLERGSQHVPTITKIFEANGVSPIIGIYLPMIESEFRNDLTSPMGAIGMFQFLAPTAQKYGLTPEERTDIEKSATAAAKFLAELQNTFSSDAMKEALALTAYNQGPRAVKESLQVISEEKDKSCTLCSLNANKTRLSQNMQTEGLKYVPMFFAAAIVGENPQSFGIQLNPLSSYTQK